MAYQITPRIVDMLNKGGPAQRTEEWLEMRGNRITGSIVDIIVSGKKIYENSPTKLMLQKAGMANDFKGSKFTQHGTFYEPEAIQRFEARTGFKVLAMPLVQHPDHRLLAHSPDGIVLRPGQPPALLEVKTPYMRDFVNKPGLPEHYINQVLMGLDCFDLDVCYFVQYRPAGHLGKPEAMTIEEVPRDFQWLEKYAPEFEAFWADVELWRKQGWQNHPDAAKYIKVDPVPLFKDVDGDDDVLDAAPNNYRPSRASGRGGGAGAVSMFVDDDAD